MGTGGLTAADAAVILGVRPHSVYRLVCLGRLPKPIRHEHAGLDRDVVELVSLQRLRGGRDKGEHPYWATTIETAAILGVNRGRVLQLVEADLLPGVRHGRRWYFRRRQVEVIGNARAARWSHGRTSANGARQDR